jgi:nucleotide-binding universal stress UspA family protein
VKQSHVLFSMPSKILLPMDFSASSDAALAAATDLAQHFHAELKLLHIIPTTPDFNGSDFFPETSVLQEARAGIEEKLAGYTAAILARGIKASSSIEIGNDVAATIALVIEQDSLNMVVISTHGMTGWRPTIFGSTAEKVIKLVQCPLLLLHSAKPVTSPEESISLPEQCTLGISRSGEVPHLPVLAQSAVSETPSSRRVEHLAKEASKRAERTERSYDEDHQVFTK